jgi:hypothetical protein
MKNLSGTHLALLVIGVISLAVCLGSSIALFLGSLESGSFRMVFLAASIVWFLTAGALSARPAKTPRS